MQSVHNITTSKKQLYRLVNTLLNSPESCAEKLSFAVVQKSVDTFFIEIMCIIGSTSLCKGCTTSLQSRLLNTLINLLQTCAENVIEIKCIIGPTSLCKGCTTSQQAKKQLYRLVNTFLNLLQTCAEKLSFAIVQKMVDTLKFQLNYVHYWLYKFVQRVHNITTSKNQLYMLVNTLLNLLQTCAEKLSFAVVQKMVDSLKFH